MRINKEGYKIICISGAVCVFIFWLIYHLLVSDSNISLLWVSAVLLLLFWFFIVAFFREPRRVRIHDADLVFSPCDGRVVVTEVVKETEYLKEEMLQISIFMSVTSGRKVLFRQIAGLIARRIISYMKVGEPVEQNSVCGFIKFGSRVDVLIPKDSELLVEIGDPVVGSQTPIARLHKI